MKPKIDGTEFGSITVDAITFNHDILICLNGKVKKRKKKLSKAIYGTSHTISLDEAKYVYEKGAERLIIGSGQYGKVELSDEAADYFKQKKCFVELSLTPKAVEIWNKSQGNILGLFHITC